MRNDGVNVPGVPAWLSSYAQDNMLELSDRDAACLVLPDLEYNSQLAAIRGALAQHRIADEAFSAEIREIEEFAKKTSGIRNEQAVDEWVDRLHEGVYEDAARSMAAVGLIAPFMESIFHHAFRAIGHRMTEKWSPPSDHPRCELPAKDQWDCHFAWEKGRRTKDLVRGIMQLAEAIDMTKNLPGDLRPTLAALFGYRNKMFHCGFEWPVEERQRFDTRIGKSGWPAKWFSKATSDGEPWVFYMSASFIDHCVITADKVITGIGAFCNEQFSSNPNRKGDLG